MGSSPIGLDNGKLGIEMCEGGTRDRLDGELRRGDLGCAGTGSGSLDMLEIFLFNELRGEEGELDVSGVDGASLRLFSFDPLELPDTTCKLTDERRWDDIGVSIYAQESGV